jgi:hypothetical protein
MFNAKCLMLNLRGSLGMLIFLMYVCVRLALKFFYLYRRARQLTALIF